MQKFNFLQFLFLLIIVILLLPLVLFLSLCFFIYALLTQRKMQDIVKKQMKRKTSAKKGRTIDHEA